MRIMPIKQGSQAWHDLRAKHFTASEASVMMGCSPHMTRRELLAKYAVGTDEEVGGFKQRIFDKGHEVEAMARPMVEARVGTELFPVTATADDRPLLASFDGIDLAESIVWENKQWSEEKAAHIRATGTVPDCDKWQVVQQSLISGAPVLYTVTDGTGEKFVCCTYHLTDEDAQALLDGWRQFEKDVQEYVPEAPAAEVIPAAVTLPAVSAEVSGSEITHNLDTCIEQARDFAKQHMARPLEDDQDFADNANVVKAVKDLRKALKDEAALVERQFHSLHAFMAKRGELDGVLQKLQSDSERRDKAEKDRIKAEIATSAKSRLVARIEEMSAELPSDISVPLPVTDFATAFKNKRTLGSLREAADLVVTNATIEARRLLESMLENLKWFFEQYAAHRALFVDLDQLATREREAFTALVEQRVSRHIDDQAARKVAEEAAQKTAEQTPAQATQSAPATRTEPDNPAPALPIDALEDWRARNRVSKKAMTELMAILRGDDLEVAA